MDKSFWKGVIVGAGGLLLISMLTGALAWLPWVLVGAGATMLGGYLLTKKSRSRLEDPVSKSRRLSDDFDKHWRQ